MARDATARRWDRVKHFSWLDVVRIIKLCPLNGCVPTCAPTRIKWNILNKNYHADDQKFGFSLVGLKKEGDANLCVCDQICGIWAGLDATAPYDHYCANCGSTSLVQGGHWGCQPSQHGPKSQLTAPMAINCDFGPCWLYFFLQGM